MICVDFRGIFNQTQYALTIVKLSTMHDIADSSYKHPGNLILTCGEFKYGLKSFFHFKKFSKIRSDSILKKFFIQTFYGN